MALQAGIVGLPNVGKSTLFNALSNAKAQAANFPFAPSTQYWGDHSADERLFELEKLVHPQRVVPATVEIVDIAGLVKGASKGEGLGNQFLGNIRNTDAIIHVLRCFDDDNVIHVDGSVNPVRDKEIIDTELQLKDLDTVEKKISRSEKIARTDKDAAASLDILKALKQHLEQGKMQGPLK
jgi:GTP-binding protein YchF